MDSLFGSAVGNLSKKNCLNLKVIFRIFSFGFGIYTADKSNNVEEFI